MRNKYLRLQAFLKILCLFSLDLMADPNKCKFEDHFPTSFKIDDISVHFNGTKTFTMFGRVNAEDHMRFKLIGDSMEYTISKKWFLTM